MSPTKTKSGAPNYKGLYQETQKTLAKERERVVGLYTALRQANTDSKLLLSDNRQLIQQNKTMFKYVVSMAIITILTLIWGLLL